MKRLWVALLFYLVGGALAFAVLALPWRLLLMLPSDTPRMVFLACAGAWLAAAALVSDVCHACWRRARALTR